LQKKESISNFEPIRIKKEKSKFCMYDNQSGFKNTIFSVKYDNKQLCIQTKPMECYLYKEPRRNINLKTNQIKKINRGITANLKHDCGIDIDKYEQTSQVKISQYMEVYDINDTIVSFRRFSENNNGWCLNPFPLYGKYLIVLDHICKHEEQYSKTINYCWKVIQIQKLHKPEQIIDESDDTDSDIVDDADSDSESESESLVQDSDEFKPEL
jgi:hypothetical protein